MWLDLGHIVGSQGANFWLLTWQPKAAKLSLSMPLVEQDFFWQHQWAHHFWQTHERLVTWRTTLSWATRAESPHFLQMGKLTRDPARLSSTGSLFAATDLNVSYCAPSLRWVGRAQKKNSVAASLWSGKALCPHRPETLTLFSDS
jgi:hypothetical protein